MLDDEFCLTLNRDNPSYFPMYDMLRAWNKVARKYRNGEINREDYDKWRYNYPKYDETSGFVKVPSQQFSDAMVEAFKERMNKNE